MPDCDRFRAQMLEAEPVELSGMTETPLSRHLGVCPSCRQRARRLIEGHRVLDRALLGLEPRLVAPLAGTTLPRGRPRIRWRWPAVAAAVVLWLAVRGGLGPQVEWSTPSAPVSEPDQQLATTGNAVVIATENPDITIVWFY